MTAAPVPPRRPADALRVLAMDAVEAATDLTVGGSADLTHSALTVGKGLFTHDPIGLRRGRADAPARGAPGPAARHAEPPGLPPGGRGGDRGGLAAGAGPGRRRVLGSGPRVAVEAAFRLGWGRWIGEGGAFVGMEGFGASGPVPELCRRFRITPEAVASAAE